MADSDPSDQVFDTNRRFEIYVPSPKARINLGAPSKAKDSNGPFGYTGLSLQSDVHLFIDANKHTLFQTGQNFCGQVGGKWMQYSNADMIMSCTANASLSADNKILVAAGAGQGQVTAIDHGTFPRMVPYNAMKLHYELDAIQVGLFEFFHGRYDRKKSRGVLGPLGAEVERFDRAKSKLIGADTYDNALADAPGFLEMARVSLQELFDVEDAKHLADASKAKDGDPVRLLAPLGAAKVAGKDVASYLEYGFSAYYKRFDPYALIDTSTVKGRLSKLIAGFKNLLAKLRRFADLAEKYAQALTDNWLLKKAQDAMSAVNNLAAATWNAFHFTGEAFAMILPQSTLNEPWAAGFEHDRNAFEDERKSGWESRLALDGSRSVSKAGDAAADKVRADAVATRQAKLTSGQGPWNLSSASPPTLTIEWDTGSTTVSLTSATAPSAATLNVSAQTRWLRPDRLRIGFDLAAMTLESVLPEDVVAWMADLFGATLTTADVTRGAPLELDFTRGSASVPAVIGDPSSLGSRTWTIVTDPTMDPPTTRSVRLDAIWSGAPTVLPRAATVRLTVDGWNVEVPLDSRALGFDRDDQAAESAALSRAFADAVGDSGSVSLGGSVIAITSGSVGAHAHVAIVSATPSTALAELGLSAGQRADGSDGAPGLSDLSNVTAAQLVSYVGTQSGLTARGSGSSLELESATQGVGSRVAVSGPVAAVVFGGDQVDEVTASDAPSDTAGVGEARAAAEYKTLISWNHELQKLPEDTRNLTRPIRDAINDAVAAMSSLEKALEDVASFAGTNSLPSPPKAIGLIANDGITLGSKDRIVGSGGKGIVFIADGGTGDEDAKKFLFTEDFVNRVLTFRLTKFLGDDPAPPTPSLGFRVLSDTVVDLAGTTLAQLAALGRGKLSAKGDDDKDYVGVGVARVVGSHAAEVAGFRKVVISARNPGKAADADGKTGGRVEVTGQTIAIGAMNLPQRDGKDDVEDLVSTQGKGFGIEAPTVSGLAGAEHLSDGVKASDGKTYDLATLSKDSLKDFAWPKKLREEHPPTKRVLVHAEKETVIVTGPYMVQLKADDSIYLGTREANADPSVNAIDYTKAFIVVNSDTCVVSHKDKGATIQVMDECIVLEDKESGASLKIMGGEITATAKNAAGAIKIGASGVEVKKGGNTLKLLDSGVQVQGSQIKWG